jgi:hypothetical protein
VAALGRIILLDVVNCDVQEYASDWFLNRCAIAVHVAVRLRVWMCFSACVGLRLNRHGIPQMASEMTDKLKAALTKHRHSSMQCDTFGRLWNAFEDEDAWADEATDCYLLLLAATLLIEPAADSQAAALRTEVPASRRVEVGRRSSCAPPPPPVVEGSVVAVVVAVTATVDATAMPTAVVCSFIACWSRDSTACQSFTRRRRAQILLATALQVVDLAFGDGMSSDEIAKLKQLVQRLPISQGVIGKVVDQEVFLRMCLDFWMDQCKEMREVKPPR